MRILVTRPIQDAADLAGSLAALGHTTLVEPLISISFTREPCPDLSGVTALALTSANGARAAALQVQDRDIRIFAVGPATASRAREAGFRNILQSDGEGVEGLASFIRRTLDPAAGKLLHLTGSATAGDLVSALSPFGFRVERKQAYDAIAAETLPDGLASALRTGEVDVALFFSPRTASLFASLVQAAALAGACGRLAAITLSPAVAKALSPLTLRKVLTAQNATTQAMLAELEKA
jgi:uroporphyrinogen-III synthase